MNAVTIGFICTSTTFLISIATLIYKYAKVVSMVERNTSDIKELKEQQHEFKGVIESSLSSIKTSLEQMNVNLKLLTQRLDYVEQGKLK